MKTGIFLLNLGSPDEPTTPAVRRYLRQFLSDARVIDIPALPRQLLLNLFILPFRSPKSAHAYKKVWTTEGSPLVSYTKKLAEKVQIHLNQIQPDEYKVIFGMRYGNPSIQKVLNEFYSEGIRKVILVPLYPQYAAASTGSSIAEVYRVAGTFWDPFELSVAPAFYNQPFYLESFARRGESVLSKQKADHILFSFHGVPERQLTKSEGCKPGFCEFTTTCCSTISDLNANCYRAQCFDSARNIAKLLNLKPETWSVSFQSRLGRTKWIEPYTDVVLTELAGNGIKNLVVFSPSFVADCLETLEEIGIRAVEDFKKAGGESLTLVPSLNEGEDWARGLAEWIQTLN
ncbi:MAG: ferrochelatase [Bacteroidetes bacterium]|nr:ferrochelatase [Bacteroidota bacterium]